MSALRSEREDLAAMLAQHTPGSRALCDKVADALLAAGYRSEREARDEVKGAVEDWFTDISLDDLFAVKGWSPRRRPVASERPCSYCKAEPGEPCRSRDGSRYITLVGTPKFHAKRWGLR